MTTTATPNPCSASALPADAIDSRTRQKLRRALLAWYDRHQRQLPWRATPGHTPNPYHVLVSEAMLQQTQVATVIDYFHRFIDQFPTPQALAQADPQRVLTLWQGLGYYRRARNLHAAAKQIVQHHGGQVPDTVDDLQALPGVGRYTAGAVASIAFGKPTPVLDGNVARVLARWLAIQQPIDHPKVRTGLWSLAKQLVPPKRPGDFNQALMELGALVCQPRTPQCTPCPVSNLCQANQQNLAHRLPITTPRTPPRRVTHHVVAIKRGNQYLFHQRPDTGLWSRMWQMPTAQDLPAVADPKKIQQWIANTTGLLVWRPDTSGEFVHLTTHRTIRFRLWTTQTQAGRLRRGYGQWRRLNRIEDLPMPNPQRRAIQMILPTQTPNKNKK